MLWSPIVSFCVFLAISFENVEAFIAHANQKVAEKIAVRFFTSATMGVLSGSSPQEVAGLSQTISIFYVE